MNSKILITLCMLLALKITAYCQFESFNSFEELDFSVEKYIQTNHLDSAILLMENGRDRFPEFDKIATYKLNFLYLKTKQKSKAIENWEYGLKKRYYFGYSVLNNSKWFENNPEFNRLAEIDKQIGDSLTNLSHVAYEVLLPANYSSDKEYPILFVFHGNDRNIYRSKQIWSSRPQLEKFITIYVQSYIFMSNYGYWDNMDNYGYEWKLNDEKTNKEFKDLYEQIIRNYTVNKNKVIFCGMSKGCSVAIDYAFNQFVPVYGLVLNCPVVPGVSDISIRKFVDKNKKIGIITGENDSRLNSQKDLINKVGSLEGNSKITINTGLGHQFSNDFSTILDDYLNWMLE